MDHTKFELSPDGKTLTLTVHDAGQPKPVTVVYDKMWFSTLVVTWVTRKQEGIGLSFC
jgi:hypothetical protein